jgi:non-canonical purine NTP pyrophosphatase (RdgB/HAM1 family)
MLEDMVVYFITGNQGKLAEAQSIIPGVKNIELDLPEIQALDPQEVVAEKLKEAIKTKKGEFFIEDVSLHIECLNGFPGPLIKWMLKAMGNQGIYDIVSKYENHNALGRAVIGYTDGKEMRFFTGELRGKIVEPRGAGGFGWDPIFQPDGYNKTLAEMNLEEKNKLSMRKAALMKMADYLKKRK